MQRQLPAFRFFSRILAIAVAWLGILLFAGDCSAGLRRKLPGGRFQIGDMVFQIPESQIVTGAVTPRPGDYSDYPPDRLDKQAELIEGLSIDGPDAFRPSGTHSRAKGPEDSTIQIILRISNREKDYWCRKPPYGLFLGGKFLRPEDALEKTIDFYVYGKPEWGTHALVAIGPQTFFFAPVALEKTKIGPRESLSYFYTSYVSLSRTVILEVRFAARDLKGISIFDLLKNVQSSVMSWRTPMPFSPSTYAHESSTFCAD